MMESNRNYQWKSNQWTPHQQIQRSYLYCQTCTYLCKRKKLIIYICTSNLYKLMNIKKEVHQVSIKISCYIFKDIATFDLSRYLIHPDIQIFWYWKMGNSRNLSQEKPFIIHIKYSFAHTECQPLDSQDLWMSCQQDSGATSVIKPAVAMLQPPNTLAQQI